MFPKTTAVSLFYSDTTTSSDLLDLNSLLERIFKFSERFTKSILLEQKRENYETNRIFWKIKWRLCSIS